MFVAILWPYLTSSLLLVHIYILLLLLSTLSRLAPLCLVLPHSLHFTLHSFIFLSRCILPLFTCSSFYSVCLTLPLFPHFCCSLVPFMLFDFPSHFYSPLQYTRHFLFTHFVDVLSWCIHCYYNSGTILSDATIEI